MGSVFSFLKDIITAVSDFICGYPLFILLIGGGFFLFCYSGAIPIRKFGTAIKALGTKGGSAGKGQISSFQALMSTISSTVGMGNIAGVAIAIAIGGPGAIFWMWVSALFGMATKFFEGTLALMYRGKDKDGNTVGGPMYVLTEGISRKLKPLAVFFAVFGMIGCLCVMQANQLTASLISIIPEGSFEGTPLDNYMLLKLCFGIVIGGIVSIVVLGGIERISKIASKIVPLMVGLYFVLVFVVIVMNFEKFPHVFADICSNAFNFQAGFGALSGIAIIGARRAMYVNEAGVGTASLMHGASNNTEPVREGLVAMLGPAIDSGLVCTLTAIPILMAGQYPAGPYPLDHSSIQGLTLALDSYEALIPYGNYLLTLIVAIFAFSTMFSYSYYGTKCAAYLFGNKNSKYYIYFYLAMIVFSCVITLDTVVCIMDLAFALMAIPTMFSLLWLAPKAKAAAKEYFSRKKA